MVKPGFKIKLLTAIKAGNIIIPKNDIVTVVEISRKGITVQDILDNKVILPKEASFKIISTGNMRTKITSAVVPFGTVYEQEKLNLARLQPSIARTKSIQLAQVLASNAASSEDPIVLARLSLAGSLLSMSLSSGIDQNQYSRLYQLARKISQLS